jgi:hypothetical protein
MLCEITLTFTAKCLVPIHNNRFDYQFAGYTVMEACEILIPLSLNK